MARNHGSLPDKMETLVALARERAIDKLISATSVESIADCKEDASAIRDAGKLAERAVDLLCAANAMLHGEDGARENLAALVAELWPLTE